MASYKAEERTRTIGVPLRPPGYQDRRDIGMNPDFGRRLYDVAAPHLFSLEDNADGVVDKATLHLSTLQRMCLHQLRDQLVRVVHSILDEQYARENDIIAATRLLHAYVEAVRDYDFMVEKQEIAYAHRCPDPFEMTTLNQLDSEILRRLIAVKENAVGMSLKKPLNAKTLQKGFNILPGSSRHERSFMVWRHIRIRRLLIGMLVWFVLMLPIMIMVFIDNLLSTLVTTTISTLVVTSGFALVVSPSVTEGAVFAAIAAYTAVLVVFIGVRLEAHNSLSLKDIIDAFNNM